ncbi:hypothetical protein FOCC_FOCC003390 [Frankliniella occidentalis]|nr:hypothetical protein FOCC_FOCC003390 [Frankliniella occidentalis]
MYSSVVCRAQQPAAIVMSDSDDDITILEEKLVKDSTKRWKWKTPNPVLMRGDSEQILQSVRVKLNMQNKIIPGNTYDGSPAASFVMDKRPEDMLIENQRPGKRKRSNTDTDSQKTPTKSNESKTVVPLTPEQILELTENCLDSDNEPELTPVKESPQTQQRENSQVSSSKRALNFGIRASSSLRNRSSKFFGAGTSSTDVDEILSQETSERGEGRSPSRTPSPRKKRLPKNSPIRLLPSHSHRKSPAKPNMRSLSPRKSPGPNGTPKKDEDFSVEDHLMIPEGPYYYEAFCFMIKKVCENSEYTHLFLDSEHKKLKEVYHSREEFQLYVRLMNRKDKWNRCSDIKYNDISANLTPHFDYLESQGFISCDLKDEKIEDILSLLKLEELKTVCSTFKVKKEKLKSKTISALVAMQKSQPTILGMPSPLLKSVVAVLGRCVKLNMEWRRVFRRCILLFSLFHSHEDLDKLCSEQALLLLQVKLGNMVLPLADKSNLPSHKVFETRDQLIRFEEAKELKQSLSYAMEVKNFDEVQELVRKIMNQFAALRKLTSETQYILQLPKFLHRFCAGTVYAVALTQSIEALKQARQYQMAIDVLDLLNDQTTYCPDYKGKWMLNKATIFHVNLKELVKASNVLYAALRRKSLFNSVDRMHLHERAEKIIKLKKNGLSNEQKQRLQNEMDPPHQAPEAVEISARAYISSKPGLKKVYIRDTEDGKEFMSVEETVIAHYKSLGFLYGIHDEGSTISSLCMLSLWHHIYDTTIPGVFQSPFQEKPLDWGKKIFYELRKDAIETRLANILAQDVPTIAKELSNIREENCLKSSVINWDRLERLDIQKFLECVSIPTFVAITRRLIEDFKCNRSGFPDLVIWSPPQKQCLFVEVKSPNDVLSTVQCLWLDFLKNCNAKAVVAHIRESGSKTTAQKK